MRITAHPPTPVPRTLSAVQFWLLADSLGYSQEQVLGLVDARAAAEGWSESERRGLRARIVHATVFPRDFPALEAIAADTSPPLTPAQIDDLYRFGATL